MAPKITRPPIGSKLWDIHENMWYDKTKAPWPFVEYVVTEGEVTGYYEGSYVEICMTGPVPRGDLSFSVPRRHKLSDLGEKVFFTAREAARQAEKMTDHYQQVWGWCEDPPMRRTWERYLQEVPDGTE